MKVNRSMTSLIAAGLMVLFATNVEAQRPGGGQGGGGFRGGQGQQGGGFRGGPGGLWIPRRWRELDGPFED